jgi:hypothetical protein
VGKHDSTDRDGDATAQRDGTEPLAPAARPVDAVADDKRDVEDLVEDIDADLDEDELDSAVDDDLEDELDAELDENADLDDNGIPDKFEVGEGDPSPQTTLFWAEAEIDPVEVALPSGVGLTLRHYRIVEDDDGDVAEEAAFLAHKGKLHLFRTPEGLVAFINSDAPHDLTEVAGWDDVVRQCQPSDVVADEEDRYELDLVVENLRGGHDTWEPDVLVPAGEFARDVAFACELADVLSALAPGSPLDDLDEGIRDGGFMARRRLKKVGAEQAAIAWRSVIGKISAAVEWHD